MQDRYAVTARPIGSLQDSRTYLKFNPQPQAADQLLAATLSAHESAVFGVHVSAGVGDAGWSSVEQRRGGSGRAAWTADPGAAVRPRELHLPASRHIRVDRKRARPYHGHGRHRLGSLPATVAKRRRGGIPHVKQEDGKILAGPQRPGSSITKERGREPGQDAQRIRPSTPVTRQAARPSDGRSRGGTRSCSTASYATRQKCRALHARPPTRCAAGVGWADRGAALVGGPVRRG